MRKHNQHINQIIRQTSMKQSTLLNSVENKWMKINNIYFGPDVGAIYYGTIYKKQPKLCTISNFSFLMNNKKQIKFKQSVTYFLSLLALNFIHSLDDGVGESWQIARVAIHQQGLLLVMESVHCPNTAPPHLRWHCVTLLQSFSGGVAGRLTLTVHMETVTPWTQLRIIIHTHGSWARSEIGGSWFWRRWRNGNKVIWTEHGASS